MTYKTKIEIEYQNALKRIEDLFDAEQGTPEAVELASLVAAVETYEKENYPIEINT